MQFLRRASRYYAVALICIGFSGCDAMMYRPFAPGNAWNRDGTLLGGQPTEGTMQAGDYGADMDPATAQQIAQQWLLANLKDPESARFQWAGFGKGWMKDGLVYGGKLNFGYMIRVNVNAKNSFGGYTGAEPWEFLFHDGTLIRIRHNGAPVL